MTTFDEFNFIAPIQKTIKEVGYETPTPIQVKAIPPALAGDDVLGCAQTGTGKTAAFALPIINHLGKKSVKAKPRQPIALILAPTRELAIQIEESFATYGQNLHLRQALVYGGVSQLKQVRALKRGTHIIVATPGRLLDLMNQGHIDLGQLKYFVLDEVDRMLDMGFLPDIERIIDHLPENRQSLFFSATLPPAIVELANQLLRNPVRVNVTPAKQSIKKIKQQIVLVEKKSRRDKLAKLVSADNVDLAMVFTRTKRQADELATYLGKQKIRVAAIHGNKSQNARQRALTAFQEGKIHVLVATDVASRGIDIEGVSHVINYDLPTEPESYVHRIGRTGRAGCSGLAISFCTPGEQGALRAIEKFIGKKLDVDDQREPRSREGQSRNRNSRSDFHGEKDRNGFNGRRGGQNGTRSESDRSTVEKPKRKQRKGRNARSRSKQPVA